MKLHAEKNITLSTNTVTQSIRHILILLFSVAQGQ